jgi:hypothetical protein
VTRSDGRFDTLGTADLARLAALHDLEGYLFGEVSQRFRDNRTLSAYDFFVIVTWKSNRAKTRIRDGLVAAGQSVPSLMREVAEAPTAQSRVESLLRVWGIGLPMASAVLAVCYPEEFTILDYRAWTTLQGASLEGLPKRYPIRATEYIQYCELCRRLAAQVGLSLRDLDRALWARSYEQDLLELIGDDSLYQ